ncbi:hypothetical protein E3N88_42709 [Mikania micrantha]|uniref:Uncharacterized protein n=1 Tax=Mikania micrantha TaxID=192012 RepID=A0A5N6LGY7_9ASTR|nr:hypothetical protein E3N88_42709 [Mikania micrantha]
MASISASISTSSPSLSLLQKPKSPSMLLRFSYVLDYPIIHTNESIIDTIRGVYGLRWLQPFRARGHGSSGRENEHGRDRATLLSEQQLARVDPVLCLRFDLDTLLVYTGSLEDDEESGLSL